MPDEQPGTEPTYAQYEEFVRDHGRALLERFGAHGGGVGRKTVKGAKAKEFAVVFYVQHKGTPAPGKEPIPNVLSFTPRTLKQPVSLLTDVVEAPMPTLL